VRRLPGSVWLLGLVSFLNDVASDMVIPLIPILLAGVLAAGPVALGLIEGAADAVASFLKLWAGRHSDLARGRRKQLAVGGYLLSNLMRPLLAFAGHWAVALALRSADRIGKGVRSAPRDAMLGDMVAKPLRGLAFGLHRALDNAGAVLGALCAAAVLYWLTSDLKLVILASALPGAAAVLLMLAVREPPQRTPPETLQPLRWSALGGVTRRYLAILGAFTFARVSDTFIVLLGYQLGIDTIELLLLWAALNLMKALSSYAGGGWSDHAPRRTVLAVSWTAWAFGFWMLCGVEGATALWLVSLYVGAAAGLGEGAERALIRDYAPAAQAGTAFGWYYCLTGFAAIPAGLAFGALWQFGSAALAFSFAGAVAALSALALLWAGRGERVRE
jgi:MFS family permease